MCSDTNGALLIQGRIMKFNTYSKLYSALYSELTHSTMPLELTLTRLEVDTANDLGDICVFSKRWDVASARFVTTKNPKFVFFTIGSFMVNVCGDEGDVLHTAKQISKWLSKNNPAAANEACVSDYTGILAVSCGGKLCLAASVLASCRMFLCCCKWPCSVSAREGRDGLKVNRGEPQ